MNTQNKTFLFDWYKKLPRWGQWVLFIPLSEAISIGLWLPINLVAQGIGPLKIITGFVHPALVQSYFLMAVYFLVPKAEKKCLLILIIIRSLFITAFLGAPILSLLGADMEYDFVFFQEFIAEMLTLYVSILIYKKIEQLSLETTKVILQKTFYFTIFVVGSVAIYYLLNFLSTLPYIGWFFRFIQHMRETVY